MMKLIAFILAVFSFNVFSADFFLIDTPLHEGMKSLPDTGDLPENKNEYDTPLGVTSRCYHGTHYLILSRNDLGSGYELTKKKPDSAICAPINIKSGEIKNTSGVHLGMTKDEVRKLLNAPQESDEATLLYNQKVEKDGIQYDEQSWVDIKFEDNKLVRLSVFVSLTK